MGEMPNASKRKSPKPLTAAFVRTVTQKGKFHDGQGLGLFLLVDSNGRKFWVQRIVIEDKRHELGLGGFPLISLAEAREKAFEIKREVRAGRNPIKERLKQHDGMTFAEAAAEYVPKKILEFKNEKHAQQYENSLKKHVFPHIGNLDVSEITTTNVKDVLEPIWYKNTETASRVRGRIEAVLSWAKVAGYRQGENPAAWNDNLKQMLPSPAKIRQVDHMPAIPVAQAPEWWAMLGARKGVSALALRFLTLTAARSVEARGALWSEIDFEKRIWSVPAWRMKMKVAHVVPLSEEACQLLEDAPRIEGTDFVFPGLSKDEISDNTMRKCMRDMHEAKVKEEARSGVDATGYVDAISGKIAVPHGLRSTFRDWATEFEHDDTMAEISLAHKVGNETENAYRRSNLLERRRALMDEWARYLNSHGDPSFTPRYGIRGRH